MIVASLAGMLLAPVMLPAVARLARPAVKDALKAGLFMVERGRVTIAELTEMTEDVIAEVQAELRAERAVATIAPPAAATTTPSAAAPMEAAK